MLAYTPTPIQEIYDPLFEKAGVRVLVKREDLNHPYISGNKWWKLKFNLEEAMKLGHDTLLTFGGAYSNHIYASAAAANEFGLKSIGIIRGEEALPLNATLSFARRKGMELNYVSREAYRRKSEQSFISDLRSRFGNFYLIPEGGTNELAVKGVEEFSQTLGSDFDCICCAVGTGGTIAGLIEGLKDTKQVIGISVLKNGEFLTESVKALLDNSYSCWSINTKYHFGGYAKKTTELLAFIQQFEAKCKINVDSIYMGKMMFAVFDLIGKGFFQRGTTILILHSGGLHTRNLIC
jgi:1-aminocyclopropane-1-carboxylate deaminase